MQMDFFYRNKPWYAGQFVRKLIPKISIEGSSIRFFTTVLNKQKPTLLSVLVRDVDKVFNSIIVSLPITSTGSIDFDFMEYFIAELEAQRIAQLDTYLKTTGLDNCELTHEEISALYDYSSVYNKAWEPYRIGDLFERVDTRKLPYKAKELPTAPANGYVLPCLTSSFQNQGLNYYAPIAGATILKNVISLPSNSDVYRAYYQSQDFTVLSDSYAIRWKNHAAGLTPNQYLFFVMCINRVTNLPIYSYKNKLGGWNVVKEKFISLPVKNGVIDFTFMETFISAIKKKTIKDVVKYNNEKIKTAKNAITQD